MAPGAGPVGDGAPILLSVGEPRHQPPGFISGILTEAAADWSRYPPPRGSAAYRDAAAAWLVRRYGLPQRSTAPGGMIDPEDTILPLPGTREGLFFAALAMVRVNGGGPAPGALQAAVNLGGSLDNMLVFHSLSKRSSAPGLRCGFAVGEARLIAALDGILRVGGAGVPLPVLAAGERLWRDEDHVVCNRARYQEKFAAAGRILGDRFGYRMPGGGFFLWLDVGDGEAAAVELWRRGGLKVLPGAYTAAAPPGGGNPGAPYIRVALVHETATVEAALQRLAEIL
jgi:aspartate/methionine/tyrosine aminotransferase